MGAYGSPEQLGFANVDPKEQPPLNKGASKIAYTPNVQDIFASNQQSATENRALIRYFRAVYPCLSLIISFIVSVSLVRFKDLSAFVMLLGIVVAVLFAVFAPKTAARYARRRTEKAISTPEYQTLFSQRTLLFHDDFFEAQTDQKNFQYRYSFIKSAHSTDKLISIVFKDGSNLFIPARVFASNQETSGFLSFLRDKANLNN